MQNCIRFSYASELAKLRVCNMMHTPTPGGPDDGYALYQFIFILSNVARMLFTHRYII